jgi:hypothetical protein
MKRTLNPYVETFMDNVLWWLKIFDRTTVTNTKKNKDLYKTQGPASLLNLGVETDWM